MHRALPYDPFYGPPLKTPPALLAWAGNSGWRGGALAAPSACEALQLLLDAQAMARLSPQQVCWTRTRHHWG
jgi:hypothetical protein